MRMLIAGLMLTACACSPMAAAGDGPAPDPAAPGAAPVQSADARACAQRGGKMVQVGRLQTWRCIVSYADAGRRCTDGDQCQGDCRTPPGAAALREGEAAVGQCQATSSPFGCNTQIEDGRAQPTLCVD